MQHLMRHCALLVLLAALTMAGCTAPPAPPAVSEEPAAPPDTPVPTTAPSSLTPAEVVTAMAERFSAGDLEGGLAYWADDAIWYIFGLPPTGSELLRGKEAIRTEFENEIAAHLTWKVEPKSVVGNVVTSHDTTWLDFTRQIGVAPVGATGQYLVEDGKIVTYAWTVDPESLVKLKAALAEMPVEPEVEPDAAAPAPAPVAALTVTIADGTCRLEEPVALEAGDVQVTVNVQDENRGAYAVVFLSLDPEKDFADLMASTAATSPPEWAHLRHYEEVGPGASSTYTIQVDAGPLYGICFSKPPDHPIGNLGPIEVDSAEAETSVTQPAGVSANQDQLKTLPPACQSLEPPTAPSDLAAKEVLAEIMAHLNESDVAGAIAYFAEDARRYVFGVPPAAFEASIGRAAICQALAEDVGDNLEWELTVLTDLNLPSGALITAKSRIWLDEYRQLGVAPLEFFTRFKVKDGRIIDAAMWLQRESLANLRPVMSDIASSMASPSSDPPGSDVTMVFSDHLCSYDGPSVWKAGAMNFALETTHQAEDQNGYVIITMDEGYDLFDLAAVTSSDRPSWVRYSNIFEFGQEQGALVQHRVFENINYFLMCFSDNNTLGPVGLYGPFAVTE